MRKEQAQAQPSKKLTLHRETLQNLTDTALVQVAGGWSEVSRCYVCFTKQP
jgi:hypothetical protein